MRRTVVVVGLAAVLGGGAVALTAPGWAAHESPHPKVHHAHQRAAEIADSLANHATRVKYGIGVGTLVTADVCVDGACVHRKYNPVPPCPPAPAPCVGTSLIARRLAGGLTITVELAS